MKIYAKSKENGRIMPIVVAAAALLALFKGVSALQNGANGIIFIAVGILLLLVAFYRPQTAVDREGVDNILNIAFIKKHNLWKWEDISSLFADYIKAKPDVIIAVKKGRGAGTGFHVLREDVPRIIQWAAEANDRMVIRHNGDMDIDVPGRESMSREEYEASKDKAVDIKPQNFHQFAEEARKIKAEKEQIVADAKRRKRLKKLKAKRNEKKLESWK